MRASIIMLTASTALVLGTWIMTAHSKDDTVDWLLGSKATTAPTTRPGPVSRPTTSAFEEAPANPEVKPGSILLSNGERIRGKLSTTREKPLRFWDEEAKEYKDVPFPLIKTMEAKILWEREEKEWHFKESGSDIKEYSGKTYPARELVYEVTLVNGQKVKGGVVAPVYASGSDQTLTYVLNKRQKGDIGKTLKDLIYIKKIELED